MKLLNILLKILETIFAIPFAMIFGVIAIPILAIEEVWDEERMEE